MAKNWSDTPFEDAARAEHEKQTNGTAVPSFPCPHCTQWFRTAEILEWHKQHDHIAVLENAEIEHLRAERDALLEACKHAVDHHEPYADESGHFLITLQSYGMIVNAIDMCEPQPEPSE